MQNTTTAAKPHPQQGPFVNITINGAVYSIHRGHQSVAAIKALGNVDPADELVQIINGQMEPLLDEGAVTIKGDERFVSQPRTGGSA